MAGSIGVAQGATLLRANGVPILRKYHENYHLGISATTPGCFTSNVGSTPRIRVSKRTKTKNHVITAQNARGSLQQSCRQLTVRLNGWRGKVVLPERGNSSKNDNSGEVRLEDRYSRTNVHANRDRLTQSHWQQAHGMRKIEGVRRGVSRILERVDRVLSLTTTTEVGRLMK